MYNTEMTNVFSGGFAYEYSEEGNGYGLVTINGNTVTPNAQFTALKSAYANVPNPTGNGGASSTQAVSTCPTQSSEWDVENDDLPVIPSAAAAYFSTGAGPGPGLNGPGSQDAGGADTESPGFETAGAGVSYTATASSSTATGSSSSSSKKSAGTRPAPLDVKAFSVVVVTLAGVLIGMICL